MKPIADKPTAPVWSRINTSVWSHNPKSCEIHKVPFLPPTSPHLPTEWREGSQPSQVWKLLFNNKNLLSFPFIHTHTHTHTRSCIFTYLIHYHFLGNSRIDRPQGIILCPRSSSASIEGTSGTEERRPKAIKVPDHRVKTHRDSRPPKNCPLDPVFPP